MMEVSTLTGSRPDLLVKTDIPPQRQLQNTSYHPLAEKFEAAFMAEMLKYTGLGETEGSFSGGHGAQAFNSFLMEAYAQELAKTSPIGIADAVALSLSRKGEDQ